MTSWRRGIGSASFVVWAEMFAACDHPQTVVQWSDFEARTVDGDVRRPASVRLTFPTGGRLPEHGRGHEPARAVADHEHGAHGEGCRRAAGARPVGCFGRWGARCGGAG